jgi:hypothetical protein
MALLALTLIGGCATRYQPAPATLGRAGIRNPADAEVRASERAMLYKYARERDCEGAAYSRAHEYAVAKLNVLASAPTETGHINDAAENGKFRLRLAAAAANKNCFDVARKNYDEIMEIFTGPPYSALRRRAMSGLAHLGQGASQHAGIR